MSNSVPTFETSRLILRAIELSDAPTYQKNFADYEVISQLASVVPWPYPGNGAEDFIRNVILPQQGKDRWFWGLFLKEDPGEMIGGVDLWREGSPENRGFWLGKKFWGQGIMTEAVEPVMDHAFDHLGFEKLVFSNAVGNVRSRRVKEKTGARLIGTRPAKFVNPEYTEAETWELTRSEWRKFRCPKLVIKEIQSDSTQFIEEILKPFSFSEEKNKIVINNFRRELKEIDSNRIVLLGSLEERPVATVQLVLHNADNNPELANGTDIAHVHSLWVRSDFSRRGFGEQMMCHLEKVATERKIKQLTLGVDDYNETAYRLYSRRGYEVFKEEEGRSVNERLLLMRKNLDV